MSSTHWGRSLLVVLGVCLLAAACHDARSAPEAEPASVEFALGIKEARRLSAASARSLGLESATAIVVSIVDSTGTRIYDSKQVALYNFNGDFLSHPLSLQPGSYRLTQFLVINGSGQVLYATPAEGAPLAHLVADPLPVSFNVSKDAVTTVRPEVLSTAAREPQDFGYASFGVHVVEALDFLVAAFVYDSATRALVLTTASIEVADEGGRVLYAGLLQALTNRVSVPAGRGQYRVTVTKPGHERYRRTFTSAELAAYFSSSTGGPLTIVLRELARLDSCKAILDAGLSRGDGLYTVDPDGAHGALPPFEVYCDMSLDGGGWTLIGRGSWWSGEADALPPGSHALLTESKRQALLSTATRLFRLGSGSARFFIADSAPLIESHYHYWRTEAPEVQCATSYEAVLNGSMVTTSIKQTSCDPKGVGQHTCGVTSGWILVHNNDTFNMDGNHPCAFGTGYYPTGAALNELWVR